MQNANHLVHFSPRMKSIQAWSISRIKLVINGLHNSLIYAKTRRLAKKNEIWRKLNMKLAQNLVATTSQKLIDYASVLKSSIYRDFIEKSQCHYFSSHHLHSQTHPTAKTQVAQLWARNNTHFCFKTIRKRNNWHCICLEVTIFRISTRENTK